jgi:putative Mg2+ transporter-C (MgtC) family protein
MQLWLADAPFFGGPGQGTRQIIELFAAFGLTALIGFEREIQGKSAGVRTQTIVGTAAALILLVSKYGFSDVLQGGLVIVDPSRVAAKSSRVSAFSARASSSSGADPCTG